MSSVLEIATSYVANGLSVIPVRADGSKAPAVAGWRAYANKFADEKTLSEWFGVGKFVGIGIVPGPVSGNLVILDFENHGESAYVEWIGRLPDELRELALSLPTVSTPSGGRHVYVRLPVSQPGGKLARYAVTKKTKIEIRGEGNQILAPGCPAECHESGQLYGWAIECPLREISFDEWLQLLEYCGRCNEYTAPEQPRDRDAGLRGTPAGVDSPGNDFNRRGSWGETGLFDAGWTWARQLDDGRGYLTRPGKGTGVSSSVGVVSSRDHGYPYLFVWSTNTEFAAETPFSKFAVFAILKHDGNYSDAAKELSRLGYGERRGMSERQVEPGGVDLSGFQMTINTPGGKPASPFANPEIPPGLDAPRNFKWMSELDAQSDDTKWLWKGYIPRGGITLFSALWKSGKSTLLSHLLRAFDGSVDEFLGLEIQPSRILYVTEEDEGIWGTRRDELLLGDHIGIWCRPFDRRPVMQEWRDHLVKIKNDVEKFHFDLVVIDTLSKIWPVRDENNAGEVEEALMPLWTLSRGGTSILLVHHSRKSGGEQFVGARGSGGLSAFCELLMEFARDTPDVMETKRVITSVGRYSDIPPKLLCELKNGRYTALGDPDDAASRKDSQKGGKDGQKPAKRESWRDDLDSVLAMASGAWKTKAELMEAFKAARDGNGVSAEKFGKALDEMLNAGQVARRDQTEEERVPGQSGKPSTLWRLVG